ncbi:glutaminyl-peptide cyclotransferase [Marinoscillum pacificum]|uniref:glutaminyl-peptide cyclotransferase n=1 Tax=Marinoscillum pacificum TaxID=392723 RepID=UPI002157CC2A|nr:glutaminyl-peptide cyclotransferase [Marinoscillum pacificum]
MNKLIHFLFLATLLFGCSKNTSEKDTTEESVPLLHVSYAGEYPHDTNAFTEGLLFHQGELFESTGATDLPQTRSLFGTIDLNTGAIDVKVELDREQYFGEGITFLNGRVYQLTYQSQKGFVYDDSTYEQIQEFSIPSEEGWGLTTDGTSIIMSDGTAQLTYLDPVSLAVTKNLIVKEEYFSKENLNELEYVNGFIYANIWMTNEIVKIDAKDGNVVGKMDLTSYATDAKSTFPNSMEMNGIAYHPERKSFFITGKLWPKIYEVRF